MIKLEWEGWIERKGEGKSQVIKLGNKPIDIAVGSRPFLAPEVSLKLVSILIFQRSPIVISEYKSLCRSFYLRVNEKKIVHVQKGRQLFKVLIIRDSESIPSRANSFFSQSKKDTYPQL